MYYFSPATSGFYHSDLHGVSIPCDAFALSEGEYCGLVSNAPKGTVLSLNTEGRPERIFLAEPSSDAQERAWRDNALELTQWLVLRDSEELEMGEGTTLRVEEFKQLLAYRQALRDWPNDPDFPDEHARPVEPDWLDGVLRANN